MDARCKIELFGRLRVVQDGRVITRFQTRQTGAVLAYLAFHRDRSHPRDVLMGIAWPEDEQYTDRHKLRVALSSLPRQLEPPGVPVGAAIVADRGTVQLNPTVVTTDVAEFEAALQAAARARSRIEREQRLVEAVALYRGELLPGCFEEWILPQRQPLAQAHLQALEQLLRP